MKFKKDSIHKVNEDKINTASIMSGRISPDTLRQKVLSGSINKETVAAMVNSTLTNKGK